MSQTQDALNNLKAIKEGRDPRATQSHDVEILDSVKEWHDSIQRTRDEIDDEFVRILNIVQPENPFRKGRMYPVSKKEVKFSYCTSSGSYYAKCGPREFGAKAFFACDKKAVGKMTTSRYYVLLIHEMTHITEGSHSQGSTHNPAFWKAFADNCVALIESEQVNLDLDKFVTMAREDPHSGMVDKRSLTVEEQKQRIEDRILRQL
jgi:hypothetical protein